MEPPRPDVEAEQIRIGDEAGVVSQSIEPRVLTGWGRIERIFFDKVYGGGSWRLEFDFGRDGRMCLLRLVCWLQSIPTRPSGP